MIKEDRFKELSPDKLKDLTFKMDEYMRRVLYDLFIAGEYSSNAEEELVTSFEVINGVSQDGVGFCSADAVRGSLTLLILLVE